MTAPSQGTDSERSTNNEQQLTAERNLSARRGEDGEGYAVGDAGDTLIHTSSSSGLQKLSHGFWDPEVAKFREKYFKIVGMTVVLSVIVVWLCLPFYWGSLWKERSFSNRLTTYLIDLDGGSEVSQAITSAVSTYPSSGALGWTWSQNATLRSVAAVEAAILNNNAWSAIVIAQGTSERLAAARASGNSSYDPKGAVLGVYQTARNEQAAGNFIVSTFSSEILPALAQVSAKSSAAYMAAHASNQTALNLLVSVPTTISGCYSMTNTDLRPYTATVASAVTLVGLIYLLVLSFILTMSHEAARAVISPWLNNRSYIILRLVVPGIAYGIVSFFFGLINLPFKVPFGAHFGYAGGFFLWWIFLWLAMSSLGYATESVVTLIGPKFMAFFLIPLIIINVSEASVPIDLQPWIYRIGYALPFYNLQEAVRTIIFNTKNKLGLNAGVLVAWIAVSFVTLTMFTLMMRWREQKVFTKEATKGVEKARL